MSTRETIDITPSPRVLEMLGEVDMSPEECFAEFIDNALDEGIEGTPGRGQSGGSEEPLQISIEIPSEYTFKNEYESAEVIIRDNGPGMSKADLEKNVRAGYSDKNPVDEMGLFGMGFNIATARLGNRTTVKTTREGDDQWAVTTIDFRELKDKGDFEVDVEYQDKEDSADHGTIIRISRLNELASSLKKKWKMPQELGDWYSTVLQHENVEIVLDGKELEPRPHCTWNRQRSVEVSGEEIPTRIDIQEKVGEGNYCQECWSWLDDQFGRDGGEEHPECRICGDGGDVVHREQVIWGWLGIQRFYDKEDYGIDLIRNGRIIEKHDKSFFYCEDPEGKSEKEYPLDGQWGGRIVGELHIDFVPVSNTKDKFDRSNSRWEKVREVVKGKGPIRPKIAKRYGYDEPNRSPLALLNKGYRYAKPPGKKHIVPGKFDKDGHLQGGDNVKPKEMAKKFWDGEDEYQDDSKWWELVERAERAQRESSPESNSSGSASPSGSSSTSADGGGSTGVNLDPDGSSGSVDVGDGNPAGGDAGSRSEASPVPDDETPSVQQEFEKDEELSGIYGLDDIGEPDLEYKVYRLIDGTLAGEPIKVERHSYKKWTIRYDPGHPFFADFNNEPIMSVLMEVASTFRTRLDDSGNWRHTRLFAALQEKYCDDLRVSPEGLAARAQEQLRRVKASIASEEFLLEDSEVSDDVVEAVREKVLQTAGQGDEAVEDLLASSAYLEYAPHRELVRYFEDHPEQFFEGTVWEQAYSSLGSDELKRRSVNKFVAYLNDVIMLANEATAVDPSSARPARRIELDRAAQSLRLLEAESASL